MNVKNLKKQAVSVLFITLGAAVHALAFNWCYSPNSIAFGGITGVAQIINALLPWAPVGVLAIVLNIPLFLLGWKLIGGKLLVGTLYAMLASSVFIDLLSLFQWQPMEPVLACIFGGVLLGVSLGLVFQQGATTGGTDLMARLLKLKLAWLPMGRLVLAIDLAVIVATAIVFGSLESALYGLVGLYISSIVMDGMLYGTDSAKVAYIISDRDGEIAAAIVHDLDRGLTFLQGEGGYSGETKRVIMCAIKQRQIVQLKRLVKELDPTAFVIVCDAHEVLGDGFREYKQNDL